MYWLWFAGGGPTANTVARGHERRPIFLRWSSPARPGERRPPRRLSPATRATEGIWSPLNNMPTTCSPGAQLWGARRASGGPDLAGVDGGVELLADHGGRTGGRHGSDVPRGGDLAVARSLGGEHGAGRQALGGDQDRHLLAEDSKTRSGDCGAHEHQSHAEADLPGTALVGGDEVSEDRRRASPSGGGA